jgi:molecular chaperone IbpA
MGMTDLAFAPLSRSLIGFDRMFEDALRLSADDNYPPYNIEKTGEDAYRVTLAVAGFTPDELTITWQPNSLLVAGKKAEQNDAEYLHRGIAGRSFQRELSLADYVKVSGTSLENGMLCIDLVREVPEALKPRRIEIANNNQPQQIEGKAA